MIPIVDRFYAGVVCKNEVRHASISDLLREQYREPFENIMKTDLGRFTHRCPYCGVNSARTTGTCSQCGGPL